MTTNNPEAEDGLFPCPNCRGRAGRATKRASSRLPVAGLWKVSCQRPGCPLAMTYFHPAEWNRMPRVSEVDYEALQAECEQLRNLLRHAQPIIRAHAGASHMLDGFRPKRNQWDELVDAVDAAIQEDRQ